MIGGRRRQREGEGKKVDGLMGGGGGGGGRGRGRRRKEVKGDF